MAIKPQNTIPVLKDKVINVFLDLSSGYDVRPVFLDTENSYTVISASVVVYSLYNAANPAEISVGHSAYTDRDGLLQGGYVQHYVNNASLGNSELTAGTPVDLPINNTHLPAGASLLVEQIPVVSQVGEVMLCVKLRPVEKANGNASKRPGASA